MRETLVLGWWIQHHGHWFLGSVPALVSMGRLGGDLGHSEDPQHSRSLALELSRALCMQRDAKVSFSKHVCSFPGLTKTPQHLGKAEEWGEEASKAQSVAY